METLRSTIRRAQEELAEDAKRYLELFAALSAADPQSEAYEDLEVETEVHIVVLQTHATSLSELIDELNDALANDEA